MMRKLIVLLLVIVVVAAGAAWFLSAPRPLAASAMDGLSGDADRGEQVFWATGCASCQRSANMASTSWLCASGVMRLAQRQRDCRLCTRAAAGAGSCPAAPKCSSSWLNV